MASKYRQMMTTSLPSINLKVTTDDNGKVYIDGALVLTTELYKTYDIKIPGNIEIIAIEATSLFYSMGFMLETSVGIVSDKSWKCTNEAQGPNWFSTNFKDDKWPKAIEYASNSIGYLFMPPNKNFMPESRWIGFQSSMGNKIFCRKRVKRK